MNFPLLQLHVYISDFMRHSYIVYILFRAVKLIL